MISAERLREVLVFFPEASQFYWRESGKGRKLGVEAGSMNGHGYRVIMVDRKSYGAHRLVWLYYHGYLPKVEVDHINGNRCDNSISNLRIATRSQNAANVLDSGRNKSGFRGVSFHKERPKKPWLALIRANGKNHYLGNFEHPEDAYAAYLDAAARLHGEFAREQLWENAA